MKINNLANESIYYADINHCIPAACMGTKFCAALIRPHLCVLSHLDAGGIYCAPMLFA